MKFTWFVTREKAAQIEVAFSVYILRVGEVMAALNGMTRSEGS